MMLHELAAVSAALAATRSRSEKVRMLAECLRELAPDERETAVAWLSGMLPGGKVNLGPAAVHAARGAPAADADADARRRGARARRAARDSRVRARRCAASTRSRRCSARRRRRSSSSSRGLMLGELRQGALEGVMADAIAAAAAVSGGRRAPRDHARGRRGAPVASAALEGGSRGLERFRLTLYEPLAPMLASPTKDVGQRARTRSSGRARVQARRRARADPQGRGGVRVFSRTGRDVTASVPEIESAVAALPARTAILDGEVLALTADGRAAAVPGHDAPVRPQARRRRA